MFDISHACIHTCTHTHPYLYMTCTYIQVWFGSVHHGDGGGLHGEEVCGEREETQANEVRTNLCH